MDVDRKAAMVAWSGRSDCRISRQEVGAILAGGLGFEPRLTESESVVLPLDDPPEGCAKCNVICGA